MVSPVLSTSLAFTKMQGLGNDYIYVNCLDLHIPDPEQLAIKLSDRHFGIGGDGVVLIMPSKTADFRMRMFNADGSESEMCGNAVRCIGKFVFEKKLTSKTAVNLETLAGMIRLELVLSIDNTVEAVRVNMGEPRLFASEIPVAIDELTDQQKVLLYPIQIKDHLLSMTCVSMGNPHAVFFVDKVTDFHIHTMGPLLERHPFFPQRANIEFAQVIDRRHIKMRVWERGSGETLACGTGACATVVAAIMQGLCDRTVTVELLGGCLDIEWQANNDIYQSGPAIIVFDGAVEVEL